MLSRAWQVHWPPGVSSTHVVTTGISRLRVLCACCVLTNAYHVPTIYQVAMEAPLEDVLQRLNLDAQDFLQQLAKGTHEVSL